jgi:glyoxylase-like metal-dependent hydrolase (beta-lactamase superfamily II)
LSGIEKALQSVWRWAAPEGDRCGTALKTADGLVLIDPPALARDDRVFLEGVAGPVRHVVLTSDRLRELAAPFDGAAVHVAGRDALPGGLLPVALPLEGPEAEAAVLWPEAADGLLVTGDVLPFAGQVPFYRERAELERPVWLDAMRALRAADPGALAPAHQGPAEASIVRSTAYAANIGTPMHARRAAPVQGPRFLVPEAERVLGVALIAPVVVRRDPSGAWVADPYACARCGAPNVPMRQTCGGPPIARLCPECRKEQRDRLPLARVMVCAGGCCTREGARAVASAARQALMTHGLAGDVDVVPVTCLGECSLGPFVRVAMGRGEEPEPARRYREQTVVRARRFAEDENETIDDESELVLSRFAALVQPREMERLVAEIAPIIAAPPTTEKREETHG